VPISCAEVELADRAREAGWNGGWMNGFGSTDPRFPAKWLEWVISEASAREILALQFPNAQVAKGGIPDLIFERGGAVVAAECKRVKGIYRNNDCEAKPGGDTFKPSQVTWASGAIDAGISPDVLLAVWWTRLDVAPCP
jgi:hypothetical protein